MRHQVVAALALAGVCLCGTAEAETKGTYPDFTFKRVKAGKGLPGKRITVQIDPKEQAEYIAALPKPSAKTKAEPAVAKEGEGEVVTASIAPTAHSIARRT